ncbi:hypothetical protein RND81_11G131100 [Saponaria officinalis]|uniref:Nucleotide-diphospho-sugar transferase domain-containing protein n=1 Tax=Saponaria officinalis TaxID=3572 RepID=A0AAW1HLF6_SAPOF
MEMEEGKTCSCETTMTITTTKITVDSSSTTKPFDYTRVVKGVVLCSTLVVAFLILYYASLNNFGQSFPTFYGYNHGFSLSSLGNNHTAANDKYKDLRKVLDAASTKDKTVILTSLNEAWAAPNSIFDLFLESFKVGNNTAKLVDHLVVVAVDDDAFARCKATVPHCYLLKTKQSSQMAHEAVFMTPIYMDMMWERLAFLKTVLSLGYNFVFTDTDVMWFRSPFQHFIPTSDFQTSCDQFNGRQYDLRNSPNNGFLFVWSNPRTIKFYDFWVSSRHNYPGAHEQEVFNRIKGGPFVREIGLRIRFLSTDYFGGYCTPSRDFNKVCTMHANCCVGLDRKIADLKTTIEDWKIYLNNSNQNVLQPSHWRVPRQCRM